MNKQQYEVSQEVLRAARQIKLDQASQLVDQAARNAKVTSIYKDYEVKLKALYEEYIRSILI